MFSLCELSTIRIHSVYPRRKIGSKIKAREKKPPIVNQLCVVQCGVICVMPLMSATPLSTN